MFYLSLPGKMNAEQCDWPRNIILYSMKTYTHLIDKCMRVFQTVSPTENVTEKPPYYTVNKYLVIVKTHLFSLDVV